MKRAILLLVLFAGTVLVFFSEAGKKILGEQLDIGHSIGIHVPDAYADPGNIPDELQGYDFFTKPGEQRQFVDSL